MFQLQSCISMALVICAGLAMAADIPRPEHPRPDRKRPLWLNLNGTWEFEIDQDGDGVERGLTTGTELAREIVVPFCPESKLSGIQHTDFMEHVWYRRHFRVPREMDGKRLLLHFGAVDWYAEVWLNGERVGSHKGGYTPFYFDITEHVVDGENELVVHARDETRSGKQATGKQCHQKESHGCLYTRTTGIWQTVWLEAVGETWVRDFRIVADPDTGRVTIQCDVAGPSEDCSVRAAALDEGEVIAADTVPAAWRATNAVVTIEDPTLWEPGDAKLYDLELTVQRGSDVIDEVRTYFGFRKITIDGNRFLINGKPVFQRLVLDQGYYPDGVYTAPSDEALRRDIELTMAAGFNGARLHEKVFDPRRLYWADRLGFLVWDEYPNWGFNIGDLHAVGQVVLEWQDVVLRDRNHPSVIGWCPLNESGSDSEDNALLQHLLAVTQVIDPTRPFLDASGYRHLYPGTDIYDCHSYQQNPRSFSAMFTTFSLTGREPWNNMPDDPRSAYRGQPYFVSEYGGIYLQPPQGGEEGAWGYGEGAEDLQEFLDRYKALTDALLDNPNMFGFCYTQLTDIEQEQNGVYFYDRSEKYDPALLRQINERPAAYETEPPRVRELNPRTILPTSEKEPQTWRYTTDQPDDNWMMPRFDDTNWREGPGGFGTEQTPGAIVGTEWDGSDIWLRQQFDAEDTDFELGLLRIHHDEDAQVYLNGELIAEFEGYTQSYILSEITKQLREALKPGSNTLAVHCHQTVGGQFIDAGIQVQ